MKSMRGTGFLFLPKTKTFVFWHIAEISARYCRQNDRTDVAHLFCFQEIIKNQEGSGFFVQKIWNLVWNGTKVLKIFFTHIFWTKFLKIFFTHIFSARNRLNRLLIHPVMDTKKNDLAQKPFRLLFPATISLKSFWTGYFRPFRPGTFTTLHLLHVFYLVSLVGQ